MAILKPTSHLMLKACVAFTGLLAAANLLWAAPSPAPSAPPATPTPAEPKQEEAPPPAPELPTEAAEPTPTPTEGIDPNGPAIWEEKLTLKQIFDTFKWGANRDEVMKSIPLKQRVYRTVKQESTLPDTEAFLFVCDIDDPEIPWPAVKVTYVFYPPHGLMYNYMAFAVQDVDDANKDFDMFERKLRPFLDSWFGVPGVNTKDNAIRYEWRNDKSFNITGVYQMKGKSKKMGHSVSATYSSEIYSKYQAAHPAPKSEDPGAQPAPAAPLPEGEPKQ